MNIGYSIKKIRTMNNLTQDELANELYYSCQSVSNWEINLSTPPLQVLIYLSEKYDLSLSEMVINKSTSNESINEKIYETSIELLKKNIKISLKSIINHTNIKQKEVLKDFHDDEQLLLFVINKYENTILKEILNKISRYESYTDFISNEVIYILYKNRQIISLLYGNDYIEQLWKKYLMDKYYYVIINNFKYSEKENVKLFIIIFINLLQNWLSKEKIIHVESFKNYIEKIFSTEIKDL